MTTIIWVALAVGVGIAGSIFGYFLRKQIGARATESAEHKAKEILTDTQTKSKEIVIQAKDKSLQIIDQAKVEAEERRRETLHQQERLEKRESLFDQKILELENKQQVLYEKANKLEDIKKEISQIKKQQLDKLAKVAGLTQTEAKNILLDNVEQRSKEELVERIKKLQSQSSDELEKQAKEILTTVIQRVASSHAAETTTTVVSLPSDEMKGRIIGREGRNIKTIEQLTGVEIVVDDTPEAIIISGFSPIRRHLAKRALEKLIADGRIHPARIEDTIEIAKKELALDIKKAGEEAAREAGIGGLDPKLIQILGRLKYRTSYGQNVLRHSIEVSQLAGILASELGGDITTAKKSGLLHDLGKAVDHEIQGTHPEIGKDIANKFKLPEEIVKPIAEHHEDSPSTLEGVIVKVADAISGAREGARKDTYEDYLQRLDDLEKLALSFPGVEKCYAIQAGREIRVFVKPEEIDDLKAVKLAGEIAGKIEEELKYPGEIKVNVIREQRIIEYAR